MQSICGAISAQAVSAPADAPTAVPQRIVLGEHTSGLVTHSSTNATYCYISFSTLIVLGVDSMGLLLVKNWSLKCEIGPNSAKYNIK